MASPKKVAPLIHDPWQITAHFTNRLFTNRYSSFPGRLSAPCLRWYRITCLLGPLDFATPEAGQGTISPAQEPRQGWLGKGTALKHLHGRLPNETRQRLIRTRH